MIDMVYIQNYTVITNWKNDVFYFYLVETWKIEKTPKGIIYNPLDCLLLEAIDNSSNESMNDLIKVFGKVKVKAREVISSNLFNKLLLAQKLKGIPTSLL